MTTLHAAQAIPVGLPDVPRAYLAFCPGCAWTGREFAVDVYGVTEARSSALVAAEAHVKAYEGVPTTTRLADRWCPNCARQLHLLGAGGDFTCPPCGILWSHSLGRSLADHPPTEEELADSIPFYDISEGGEL